MSNVYASIVDAIQQKRLKEPFRVCDFKKACPGWAEGTYNAFLWKHRRDNHGGYAEYFEWYSPGNFSLIRPLFHKRKNNDLGYIQGQRN
jgi:hypothetical protein